MPRICLFPKSSGVGGMVSFRQRLSAVLSQRGVEVGVDPEAGKWDAVLVIGGTRYLGALRSARRNGARIVQRLDGMNWVHRQRPTGVRHFLRAEYGNWLLRLIRSRLADKVVYQSEFARDWWERAWGPTSCPNLVVYNGVDLGIYSPEGEHSRPVRRCRLLLVEGSLMGGYEMGLEAAVALAEGLAHRLAAEMPSAYPEGVELMVAGRVSGQVRQRWDQKAAIPILWAGLLPAARIPETDRSAHLLYSADIHPACPNSVIEALACGLPVVAFDTGALPELVLGDAGRVVPYGGDAWRLDPPDVPALVAAALEILADPRRFRAAARECAEAAFSLERMADGYLNALLG